MTGLAPGATLGVLGGGQLGRMLAAAALRLGLKVHIFAPGDEPAMAATAHATRAAFDDLDALDAFARAVDVVTLEFENVPVAAVERLQRSIPVRPAAGVLAVTQDRLAEKRFLRDLGLRTADFCVYDAAAAAGLDLASIRWPARLKTRRFGYDGHGQARVADAEGARDAWRAMGEPAAIVEAEVAFAREISVIVARRPGGECVAFPPAENRHADGILLETLAPASMSPAQAAEACDIAVRIATALELEGLLAVEMFETASGALVVNELAPRPHNSGHWTLDGCAPDQFEQAVRAVCDWPLAVPRVLAPARMINLLGDDVAGWREWLVTPDARLHLYGKTEARPGRKMGHVTLLEPSP